MTTPDNPLLALVRALEPFENVTCPRRFAEGDRSAQFGDCNKCDFCKLRLAIAAFKSWRPWEDDAAVEAAHYGAWRVEDPRPLEPPPHTEGETWWSLHKKEKRYPQDRAEIVAAIRAVFLHLGIGGE